MSLRTITIAIIALAIFCGYSTEAQAAAKRPVARWDVVPDQVINEPFKAGVVAFHLAGVKVEFRVNQQLVHTADNPTYNDRTGVWEFWFSLDPADYDDGPLAVDARAIPLSGDGPSYDLPALTLYANSGGSLTVNVVRWVDSVNGNDSTGDGTEAKPYQSIRQAVLNTPSGGTINLKAGSYQSQGLGGGSTRPYWTTIQAAPGVSRDDVEVAPGRPSTQRLKWKDLTIYSTADGGGYTTILVGENGSHSVWIDNVKAWNKNGRWAASTQTFGNRYVAYVTGGLTTEMANGPGGSIIRGHTLDTITSDAWSGGGRLVVNSTCVDIHPGTTGAHPDFHQSYAVAPDYVEDVILYNVSGYKGHSQGLFGSRLKNAAFVNVLFERTTDTVMYSQYSGELANVLFLHINIINQTWLWRDGFDPDEVHVINSVFGSMSATSGASTDGLFVHHNHFSGNVFGTDASSGETKYVDPASRDYRLQESSPAYASGIFLQCVPADITGKPFNPDGRNKGSYAMQWQATAPTIQSWSATATGAATPMAAAENFVCPSAKGMSALRAAVSATINASTLSSPGTTLVAEGGTDHSNLIAGLSLDDAGRTIVVSLNSSPPDATRYTLTLSAGISDTNGLALAGSRSLSFALLSGDANGDGTVDAADAKIIRENAGRQVDASTARFDLTGSGQISGQDVRQAQRMAGKALP